MKRRRRIGTSLDFWRCMTGWLRRSPYRAGFIRCLPNGCVAEVVMDDKLLGRAAHCQDRNVHHFRDPEEGHRVSGQFERDRRGIWQVAVKGEG